MTLLGMYDLDRFSVYVGAHKDPKFLEVTSRHEYVHQFLTIKSTYGRLLREAKTTADQSGQISDRRLLAILISRCRNVQESAATFDSLSLYAREETLSNFPATYVEQYQRMAAIVSPHFPGRVARSALSFAVARCAMLSSVKQLTDYQRRYREDSTPAYVVPKDEAPDDRFFVLEGLMNNLAPGKLRTRLSRGRWIPEDMVDEFISTDNPQAFVATVERTSVAGAATDALCRILCETFDEELPGLEDARATSSIKSMFDNAPIFYQHEGHSARVISLRLAAQQRVLLSNAPPPRIQVTSRMRDFRKVMKSTLGSLDAVFAYIGRRDRTPIMYHVGIPNMAHIEEGEITFNELTRRALDKISQGHPKRITLIEFDTVAQIDDGTAHPCITSALSNDCLVFVDDNPIDFLMRMEMAHQHIGIWSFQFGYETGAVRAEDKLVVVIYLLEGLPMPHFQLVNLPILHAIKEYGDIVNESKGRTVVSTITPQVAFQLLGTDTARRLIEHPVFGSFYLNGTHPRIPN